MDPEENNRSVYLCFLIKTCMFSAHSLVCSVLFLHVLIICKVRADDETFVVPESELDKL